MSSVPKAKGLGRAVELLKGSRLRKLEEASGRAVVDEGMGRAGKGSAETLVREALRERGKSNAARAGVAGTAGAGVAAGLTALHQRGREKKAADLMEQAVMMGRSLAHADVEQAVKLAAAAHSGRLMAKEAFSLGAAGGTLSNAAKMVATKPGMIGAGIGAVGGAIAGSGKDAQGNRSIGKMLGGAALGAGVGAGAGVAGSRLAGNLSHAMPNASSQAKDLLSSVGAPLPTAGSSIPQPRPGFVAPSWQGPLPNATADNVATRVMPAMA